MSHYFETPAGPQRRFEVEARRAGRRLSLVSARGVFSGSGLDVGTSVLLRAAPIPSGPVQLLDLGCGIGPITVALGLAAPQASITAVDVNDLALELTRETTARAGLGSRVQVLRPEAVDPAVGFDQIWSNPPIRIGKPALHQLLQAWLPRLVPGGSAYLVVARNLGADSLAAWLDRCGWGCSRIASAKGFRVFAVTRADDATRLGIST